MIGEEKMDTDKAVAAGGGSGGDTSSTGPRLLI